VKIWVTRAEPEAQRTAEALALAGHEALVEPLLQIQPVPGAQEALVDALAGAGALAFTSIVGVRVFAALRPAGERDLPVFAVGASTARAARLAGFFKVASADGDVADLAALIHAHDPPQPVLHPRALEPSGNLVGDLIARGVAALAEPIYETGSREPAADFLALLDRNPPDAVMIHSAKAGRMLADLLHARPALARGLVLSAISHAAAEPLADMAFARRAIALAPNEAAMLAALNG
jgi:uroporphyrinogen-III synthase